MSSVLGTVEHFMAAADSLLKDKGDEFDELKSLLLHVDQSLGPIRQSMSYHRTDKEIN
jgi:hypothetical protein